MTNQTIYFFLLLLTAFSLACANNSNSGANKSNSADEYPHTKGVKPIADPEIAVLDTDFGIVKIELYSNVAPKMVARFKELANEGFYNGTKFHRINPSLGIIQGGDPLTKDNDPANDGTGKSDKPNLPSEFTDIPYDAGIIGAARGMDPSSANSQFFIMTKRQPAFDKRYTVFGKVIEGQNNVDIMANAPTLPQAAVGAISERPDSPITIRSISIQKR